MQQCNEQSPENITNILLVEDNEGDAFLLEEILLESPEGHFCIAHAPTINDASKLYLNKNFDILLLDMNLPGLSGLDALEKVHNDLSAIPIIVMTGLDDEKKAMSAIQKGAQDYLVKGQYTCELLQRAIRYAVERKKFENRIIKLVNFDKLTGLTNHDTFIEQVRKAVLKAEKDSSPLAVLAIDLSGFTDINDTYGHDTGDELLKSVTGRLKECLGEHETISRLGSDEFLLLVEGKMGVPENFVQISRRIINTINKPYLINNISITIGCYIGIASYPSCGKNEKILVKNANLAMHRAKKDGKKNHFEFFNTKFNDEIMERISIAREFEEAVNNHSLMTYYQPIINMHNKRVCGAEALLRWNHPQKGFISPGIFIPMAESSDLIFTLSEMVLRQVCADYHIWQKQVKQPFYISVNLCTKELKNKNLADRIKHILDEGNMSPRHIALEVTESMLMEDPKQTTATLEQCKKIGASVFIDDFGTGFSSLSHLSKLPLNTLKIDRSFISDMITNKRDLIIATSTINLAHSLGLKVVAEGVETKEQLKLLEKLECDNAQGFYFAKPMPAADFREWLSTYKMNA